jgi:ubiquinone/menaquinone biosynthesis C-methylase UbiE
MGSNSKMNNSEFNRFEDFFTDHQYLSLKNFLYNYRLRKRAVGKCLKQDRLELILEIGSGISPLATNFPNVVFSDISVDAIKSLKERQKSGYYVVADGMSLPFKSHVYSHAVCSEVLEHLKDDRRAIAEIYRTLKKPYGKAIITVPHRKWYFGYDDRYVKHYRRYELPDIKEKLQSVGLKPVFISKVLGPLEKITMLPVVFFYSIIEKRRHGGTQDKGTRNFGLMKVLAFLFKWLNLFWGGIVWLDAKIMPRFLATVILIKSTVSKEKI